MALGRRHHGQDPTAATAAARRMVTAAAQRRRANQQGGKRKQVLFHDRPRFWLNFILFLLSLPKKSDNKNAPKVAE